MPSLINFQKNQKDDTITVIYEKIWGVKLCLMKNNSQEEIS